MMKLKSIEPRELYRKYWYILILTMIALLSFGLNFYAISKVGYGNGYYAAAIKSMTLSFKNFFYVAFDPAGMVSVDKPPLGLWTQAISVMIFGYHGWAMLLPQALASTCACIMMYVLTAKHFGRPAGLISSLVFAVTPAVVVASRNNTMDMQLVFVLLVAAWFLFKAIEKSKWRYLFICALLIGLGFNVKMLEAYMILPAVVIVYLIFSKEKISKRIVGGLISILIMAAVSFSWALAVDLTPAANRPYVDSSTNNTVLELIVGHNGLERLYGQGFGGGGTGKGMAAGEGQGPGSGNGGAGQNGNNNTKNNANNAITNGTSNAGTAQKTGGQNAQGGTAPQMGSNGGNAHQGGFGGNSEQMTVGGGMQGMGNGGQKGGISGNDIGNAGVFRLWSSSVYGQASWLLLLTIFCMAVKLRRIDRKNLSFKHGVFAFWILWLVTMCAFFSFAGFWHRYYLCILAPGIAGIVGPGIVEMVKRFREKHGWKQFLLPISLIATFAVQLVYVWSYTALRAWLVPVMAVTAAVSLILMALNYVKPQRLKLIFATGFMMASLLAAPIYWSLTVVMYVPVNVTMPYAGPELATTTSVRGMTTNQEALTTGDSSTLSLEKYLVAHYKKGSYLVVSERANDVAQFIVDTGMPAVAYGGFLGSDNSMTLSKLKELVKEGKVTYFMMTGQNGRTNSELISYVKSTATLINSSEYGVTGTGTSTSGLGQTHGMSGYSLYLFK